MFGFNERQAKQMVLKLRLLHIVDYSGVELQVEGCKSRSG